MAAIPPPPMIALLVTCIRSPYAKKREAHGPLISMLRTMRFEVFYVVGAKPGSTINPAWSPTIIPAFAHGVPAISVPVIDNYESLPKKMYAAYCWIFNRAVNTQRPLYGILKIDDDVTIPSGFPGLVTICRDIISTRGDYIGGEEFSRSPRDPDPYICSRGSDPVFRQLQTHLYSETRWFSGPCYFISFAALARIRQNGLCAICEDVAVGQALAFGPGAPLKRVNCRWRNTVVKWPSATIAASPRWVSAILVNGLGNRLFYIMVAMGIAAREGREFVFVPPFIRPNPHCRGQTQQQAFASIVALFPSVRIMTDVNPPAPGPFIPTDWAQFPRDLQKAARDPFKYTPWDKLCALSPRLAEAPNVAITDCYSWRYFDPDGPLPWLPAGPPPPSGAAFIHIRRGDFVGRRWDVDLRDYYVRCVTELAAGAQAQISLVLFSDAPDEARTYLYNILDPNMLRSLTTLAPATPEVTLWQMAQCTAGGICANSTFSWMAAWISHAHDPARRFWMPAKWIRDQTTPTLPDLIPPWAICVPSVSTPPKNDPSPEATNLS